MEETEKWVKDLDKRLEDFRKTDAELLTDLYKRLSDQEAKAAYTKQLISDLEKRRRWKPKKWFKEIDLSRTKFEEVFGYLVTHTNSFFETEELYKSQQFPWHQKGKRQHMHVLFIPDYEELAACIGRSVSSARKYITRLRELEIIKRLPVKQQNHRPHYYSLGHWTTYPKDRKWHNRRVVWLNKKHHKKKLRDFIVRDWWMTVAFQRKVDRFRK